MIPHSDINKAQLHALIKQGNITLGGNKNFKIYGTLQCPPGKRMKVVNRVFFINEAEAIANGYRPCGHCLKAKYQHWKNDQ